MVTLLKSYIFPFKEHLHLIKMGSFLTNFILTFYIFRILYSKCLNHNIIAKMILLFNQNFFCEDEVLSNCII